MNLEQERQALRKVQRAAYALLEAEAELMEEKLFPGEVRDETGAMLDQAHAAIHRIADRRRIVADRRRRK